MLDTDTKRRIDTARDILVGKVPDPKSQVEQITIALIYKFMDDMDAEAEELGGERAFFTGEFARYGWAKLMAPSLGGHEMLRLYGEGIAAMPQNPGIPPLFRDIFKNAYLPYRDPETLKAFLKIIDEFSYDHSERLGDAFEYLLSVLGSQGDAGQFRTPRHIIDFMVEVMAPQKHETILDPACGTAGFLISAYKHIMRRHDPSAPSNPPVNPLTPDEKARLATNFKGYDISPDMVRLSLVNLYLHGFTDPHVYEYDSLTQEDRWNEFADVILANPPFMSPKGGIKPHKRFSIQAKRSEVLFVDYMAEHLTPTGRAAIIVPEGIIFQSQTAYKELRKMLVENSLVAVVSLPAGCFNPYSGVKTSILLLDKSLAKQSDTIAFFKVENDGFGLGAQRRAIEKNDLPQVQAELAAYLQGLRDGEFSAIDPMSSSAEGPMSSSAKGPMGSSAKGPMGSSAKGAAPSQPGATPQENAPQNGKGLKAHSISRADDGSGLQPSGMSGNREPGALPQAGMECAFGAQFTTGLIVPKEKIATNGDYNLSGERYREGDIRASSYPLVAIQEVAEVASGFGFPLDQQGKADQLIPFLKVSDMNLPGNEIRITSWNNTVSRETLRHLGGKSFPEGTVIFPKIGAAIATNKKRILSRESTYDNNVMGIIPSPRIKSEFLFALLQSFDLSEWASDSQPPSMRKSVVEAHMFPLPPLDVQKEIVAEIEGYQKVINGARGVLDHYRPHIPIHPDWPMVSLEEACDIQRGKFSHRPRNEPRFYGGAYPFIQTGDVVRAANSGKITFTQTLNEEGLSVSKLFQPPVVVITIAANIGDTAVLDFPSCFPDSVVALIPKPETDARYLEVIMRTKKQHLNDVAPQAAQKNINIEILKTVEIPLPPLATQQAIVAEIEGEQALVAANRELITRFEQKIQATLARIWGEADAPATPET